MPEVREFTRHTAREMPRRRIASGREAVEGRRLLPSMLRCLVMLLLGACVQGATSSQKRSELARLLSVTWDGTGRYPGATGQGVMSRDDPVLCRAEPVSCSAISAAVGDFQDIYSAITIYAEYGDMAPLSRLLADGHSPDVRLVINGQMFITPLMLASVLGALKLMLVLLEHGADVSLTDASGGSALTYACGIFFQMQIAVKGETEAVMVHRMSVAEDRVRILMDFGAELGEEPDASCSAYRGVEASWSAYRRLVAAVKDDLGDPRHKTFIRPGAVTAARHGLSAVLRRLLERGMPTDARDDEGSTLLMIACWEHQIEIVQVRPLP